MAQRPALAAWQLKSRASRSRALRDFFGFAATRARPSVARMKDATIVAEAPGRICLFGEHQDYLGLPVIAMAVDRRFRIEYRASDSREFLIHTPDLANSAPETLDIHASAPRHKEDYCWGVAQVLLEEGFRFPRGGELTFTSNIPFRAGCSSSSAMTAAWMRLLLEIGEHPERAEYIADPEAVAYLVYKGEKEKFQGAGGMMDQYSCYLGGLIHVYPENYPGAPTPPPATRLQRKLRIPYGVERLSLQPQGFILIDSGQPKDTQGVLSSVGARARAAVAAVQAAWSGFNLRTSALAEFDAAAGAQAADAEARRIVRDHLINRDLCIAGLALLRAASVDNAADARLGALLNEEHRVLAETLGISTPRINELQQLCNSAGALGGKINGSGGGGTLFCYARGAEERVSAALSAVGARYFLVNAAPGARIL